MAQIREIKKRMTAVSTIERITKTMQMIATAKFTSSLQRARATRPYTDSIRELVSRVAEACGDELEDVLINGVTGAEHRELILVISSDRGLCGAYNSHVLRTASKHLHSLEASGTGFELQISGKKAGAYFNFAGTDVAHRHQFGDKPSFDQVAEVADEMIKRFSAGEFSAVRVIYMRFESNARQIPEVMQLLPMKFNAESDAEADADTDSTATAATESGVVYDFSPSVDAILSELLPRAVKTSLFQAVNDAVVSEQVMRMIAMKAASDNAKGLGRTLKRDFNRARQGKITTELTEIVSGAAALE
ncbi:MAG: ATP synthase F1 subunit gamma [Planctomycetes bacterium TMED75]|nr:ATP synthase F1 subunit gamma [Planctomycetaceae bacterium]OUU91058.1 MAG: ATP synthase F1 subunit gamma [Planctomycetes bacterium TMED75]